MAQNHPSQKHFGPSNRFFDLQCRIWTNETA